MFLRRSMEAEAKAELPRRGEYPSALFERFCRELAGLGPGLAVLDLGPSTAGNVMFWIGRGHAVSALDLARRAPDNEVRLEYPDASFGGVLCWTALSHLSPSGARGLVQEIGRVLVAGGWLFAVFDGDGRRAPPAQRYRIVDAGHLAFEPLPRQAPRPVLTREVELLFQAFREVRIMVMRHGSREALGRRP